MRVTKAELQATYPRTTPEEISWAWATGERVYRYGVPRERALLGRSDPTGDLTRIFLAAYDWAASVHLS